MNQMYDGAAALGGMEGGPSLALLDGILSAQREMFMKGDEKIAYADIAKSPSQRGLANGKTRYGRVYNSSLGSFDIFDYSPEGIDYNLFGITALNGTFDLVNNNVAEDSARFNGTVITGARVDLRLVFSDTNGNLIVLPEGTTDEIRGLILASYEIATFEGSDSLNPRTGWTPASYFDVPSDEFRAVVPTSFSDTKSTVKIRPSQYMNQRFFKIPALGVGNFIAMDCWFTLQLKTAREGY